MIQVNDTGLNEHYKERAAKARTLAASAIGEETKAVHLNRAKLYEQIAASYVVAEKEAWPA